MRQEELINILEEVAPPSLAESWDKSGIQVASSREAVSHVAVSLDPTPSVVRKALEAGADMLLTHHPLSLAPRYPDTLDAYHETLSLLFSHAMPLYAAHTSLDANPEGPAAWLPDELGLSSRVFLEETGEYKRTDGSILRGGIGCVGDLPAPLTPEALLAKLRELLPSCPMRLSGETPAVIRRVGVCTGSGASLLENARRLNADIFVTGDMKYHAALDLVSHNIFAESRFAVLDVGHFSLEEEMTRRLARLLTKRLPGVAVTFVPGLDPFLSLNSAVREVRS